MMTALLCAAQSMPFFLALYHMVNTSMGVGLGDVAMETTGTKYVIVAHIYLSCGTFATARGAVSNWCK